MDLNNCVSGPHLWHDDRSTIEEIKLFRRGEFIIRSPHMLNDVVQSYERLLSIDERSVHFCIRKRSEIRACIRLTPSPFEFTTLNPLLEKFSYSAESGMEISRLIISKTEQNGSDSARLIYRACEWGSRDYSHAFALCRGTAAVMFERMGLRVLSHGIRIHGRGDAPYSLLSAEWADIKDSLTRRLSLKSTRSEPAYLTGESS